MGARVAIVLLGVLAAGLPASAKELQVRRLGGGDGRDGGSWYAACAGKTGAADLFHAAFPHGRGAGASADRPCAPAQEQGPRESCERHGRRAES